MDFASAITHFFSFFLPALCLPLLLWPMARLAFGRPAGAARWWVQWLVQAAVCAAVLVVGLWVFGRDGKMLTYAALVLACASIQWVLVRGWR
ncbi:MAG: hypothetical protein ACTS5V_10120 [Giesbergeria sp.]